MTGSRIPLQPVLKKKQGIVSGRDQRPPRFPCEFPLARRLKKRTAPIAAATPIPATPTSIQLKFRSIGIMMDGVLFDGLISWLTIDW
jgi:hypothetical protein